VTVLYAGKTITVPVVDRGPFRRGTSWDLTAAAAKALGVRSTVTIGILPPAPPGPPPVPPAPAAAA
jgi:rare lipoprotein A (peptidoglycan hydrolase)